MKLRSKLLLAASMTGAFTMSGAALAQDGIEVVTVTAAKREQNVQDVPLSMNVVAQKDLEKFNMADLVDISKQVPGLVVLRGNNANTISLRGFGSSAANPAVDQTVALYMDGIFAGRARQYMMPFFDVARIEVLRGPQGALLGKNTAAGAVSIVTNNPTDEFEGSISVSYLFDRQGVDSYGYVSGPVTDDLKARLAFKYVNKQGWLKNIANNKDLPASDTFQGRLTLQWQPSESIDVITKFQYDRSDVEGRQVTGFPVALTRVQAINTTQNVPGLLGQGNIDKQNSYHFSNSATFDLGDVTLVSVSGFESYKSRAVALGRHANPEVVSTDFPESFTQGSQEFRLLSPAEQTISWIVGIYADYSDQQVDNVFRYVSFPTAAFNGQMTSYFTQHSTTYSAYATATWHVTDALQVIGGIRGTQIHRKGSYILRSDFGLPIAVGQTLNGTLDEGYFDPSLTVQYEVMPDVMVYAGYSRGSKGGTFQGANRAVTAATFQLKPEISTNWEIGAKTQVWDWLTFNVAGYILEFKNLQAGQYVGTPPTLVNKNVGAAVSQGFEVVANADLDMLTEGLDFKFSGAFIDAHYTDYPGATCTVAAAAAGCVLGVMPGGAPFNASGVRFNNVPTWSGSAELNYAREVVDGIKVELTLGADMASNIWNDLSLYDRRFGLQPGATKFNMRVALAEMEDQWSVALIGRNITDVLTTSGVYTFPTVTPPAVNAYFIDETRAFSVQGTLKF